MGTKKSRAKNLEPRPCEICQELFQPYTCRQKICGKKECQREYDMIKGREAYFRMRERQTGLDRFLPPEFRRKFEVQYIKQGEKWYWKAKADNGSILENGPFDSRQDAKLDFLEATQ